MSHKVLIINGPNLNRLGTREPEIYGSVSYADLERTVEEKAVEMFAQNILTAGNTFLDQPMDTPFIPSWNRVVSAIPDILSQLKEAVELDNEEFRQAL